MSIVTQTTAAKKQKQKNKKRKTQRNARSCARQRLGEIIKDANEARIAPNAANTCIHKCARSATRDALAAERCDAIDGALERLELDGRTDHRIDLWTRVHHER